MTTQQSLEVAPPAPSKLLAAEIRAEAARAGISHRTIALRLKVSQPWVSRRIAVGADVDMTLEEVVRMCGAIGCSPQKVMALVMPSVELWCAIRDSNPEPADWEPIQPAVVVPLQRHPVHDARYVRPAATTPSGVRSLRHLQLVGRSA